MIKDGDRHWIYDFSGKFPLLIPLVPSPQILIFEHCLEQPLKLWYRVSQMCQRHDLNLGFLDSEAASKLLY